MSTWAMTFCVIYFMFAVVTVFSFRNWYEQSNDPLWKVISFPIIVGIFWWISWPAAYIYFWRATRDE
jgi:hypothetical protein